LLKELCIYFLLCFMFFFLIFFINQILLTAETLLKKRVPLFDVMRLISYSLPFIIAQSAPFATLVGFLMCLGRMVSDNEILILRASGHSYITILLPVIVLGFLISFFSFFINDYLLPLGTIKYRQSMSQISVSNPAVLLEPYSIKRTKDSVLVIGAVQKQDVSDLLLFDQDSKGNQRIIVAGASSISAPADTAVIMQLKMNSPQVILFQNAKPDSYDFLRSEDCDMNIFESSFPNYERGTQPNEMTAYDLQNKIAIMKEDTDAKDSIILNYHVLEFYKKFALPFGSLFFAFLAMPLAVSFGKHNGQTIGLILGIVISVLYWAVFMLGQTSGYRNGFNGFWAVWLPNVMVLGMSCVLFIRLLKK
ncbi:MAG TPA: LptF/LptG family permease, partial [Treponemataceae bacterium]|nr:LptF/LptG family permease [Treponemataceae bacterium]